MLAFVVLSSSVMYAAPVRASDDCCLNERTVHISVEGATGLIILQSKSVFRSTYSFDTVEVPYDENITFSVGYTPESHFVKFVINSGTYYGSEFFMPASIDGDIAVTAYFST